MLIFENDYHGTHAAAKADRAGRLNARQVARIRRQLCPYSDCECGKVRGGPRLAYGYDRAGRLMAELEA